MVGRQEKNLNFYRQWRLRGQELNKNGIELQDIVQFHAQHTSNIPTYEIDKAKPIKNLSLTLAKIRDAEQTLAALPPEKQMKHQAQIQKLHLLIKDMKVNLQKEEDQIQSFKKVVARQAPSKDSAAHEKNSKKQLKAKEKKRPKNLLKTGLAVGAVGTTVLATKHAMSSTTKTTKTMHVKSSNLNRPTGAHSSSESSGLNITPQTEERSLIVNTANNGIGSSNKSTGGNIPKKFMPTQQNKPTIPNTNKTAKLGTNKGGASGDNKLNSRPNIGKGNGDKPLKGSSGPKPSGPKSPQQPPQTPKSNALAGIIGGIAGVVVSAADGIAIGAADGIANAINSSNNSTTSSNGNNTSNSIPASLNNPSNFSNNNDLQKKVEELKKELKGQKETQKRLGEEVKKQKEQTDEQKKQLEDAKKQVEETQNQLTETVKKMEEDTKELNEKIEDQFDAFRRTVAWEAVKGIYNYATKDDGSGNQISLKPVLECPNCGSAASLKNKITNT